MKKNMIVAFAVMMMQAVAVTAQTPKQTIYKPEQVEQRAIFPGGQEGMLSYMMQNMKYPKEAEKESSYISLWKPTAAYSMSTFPIARKSIPSLTPQRYSLLGICLNGNQPA